MKLKKGDAINEPKIREDTFHVLHCKFCFNDCPCREVPSMNAKAHCAYLLVTCDDDKRIKIITQIEQMEGFKEILQTSGVWEIIAKIELPTSGNLHKLILDRLRTLINTRSYMVLHCKFNEKLEGSDF